MCSVKKETQFWRREGLNTTGNGYFGHAAQKINFTHSHSSAWCDTPQFFLDSLGSHLRLSYQYLVAVYDHEEGVHIDGIWIVEFGLDLACLDLSSSGLVLLVVSSGPVELGMSPRVGSLWR